MTLPAIGEGRADGDGAGVGQLRSTLEADPFNLASRRAWDTADGTPPGRPGPALVRLLLVVAGIVALGYAAGVGETVLLVLAFFVCILLHELGHFATAKAAGVKVTEFFVGFGPRLWSVRRGETEYGVKAIPLGGYCRIIGMTSLEEVDPADEARTYRQAPTWRRLSISVAGSSVHFLLAVALFVALFAGTGDDGHYLTTIPANASVVAIDGLANGPSPAQQAGFRLGDRIVSIDGRTFSTWDQTTAYIRAHPGVQLSVVVRRQGRDVTLDPTPVDLSTVKVAAPAGQAPPTPTKPTGFLGIEIDGTIHPGLAAGLSDAGGAWVRTSALTLHALGHLFTFQGVSQFAHQLTSKKAADSATNQVRFESPVGVVRLFHQAGTDGLPSVLYLLAVLNISLGILNLLPLLPFDGGHVVIAAYEGVRSRITGRRHRADLNRLMPLFYLGIAFIVVIGASALFLDLRDLLT